MSESTSTFTQKNHPLDSENSKLNYVGVPMLLSEYISEATYTCVYTVPIINSILCHRQSTHVYTNFSKGFGFMDTRP